MRHSVWSKRPPWNRIRDYIVLKILDLLSQEPMHGYAIMKRLEEELGIKLSPGLLYPVLKEMLGVGLVSSGETVSSGKRIVIYEITPYGREFLEKHREYIVSFEKRIHRMKYCGIIELLTRLRVLLRNIDKLSDSDLEKLRKTVSSFLEETRSLGV